MSSLVGGDWEEETHTTSTLADLPVREKNNDNDNDNDNDSHNEHTEQTCL